MHFIGVYDNGIGFGNISIREDDGFIISGTRTGAIKTLTNEHYVKVTKWDYEKNWVECDGPIAPSSESMTHAAIYESDPKVMAVIHVHNLEFWKRLLNKIPTTSKDVAYGTPEMAYEFKRLFEEADAGDKKIVVKAGHEEGVFSFGENLDKAGNVILEYFEKFK